MLTRCQDHILTENIWFVWSETSYSGNERICNGCGTNKRTNEQTVKIELLSRWKLEAEFRNKTKRKIYCIFGDFGAFPSAAWMKRNTKPQELLEGMKQLDCWRKPSTTTFYIEEWGRSWKNFPRIMDMQKQAWRADVPIMPSLYSLSSTVQIQRARHMDVCSACE